MNESVQQMAVSAHPQHSAGVAGINNNSQGYSAAGLTVPAQYTPVDIPMNTGHNGLQQHTTVAAQPYPAMSSSSQPSYYNGASVTASGMYGQHYPHPPPPPLTPHQQQSQYNAQPQASPHQHQHQHNAQNTAHQQQTQVTADQVNGGVTGEQNAAVNGTTGNGITAGTTNGVPNGSSVNPAEDQNSQASMEESLNSQPSSVKSQLSSASGSTAEGSE